MDNFGSKYQKTVTLMGLNNNGLYDVKTSPQLGQKPGGVCQGFSPASPRSYWVCSPLWAGLTSSWLPAKRQEDSHIIDVTTSKKGPVFTLSLGSEDVLSQSPLLYVSSGHVG